MKQQRKPVKKPDIQPQTAPLDMGMLVRQLVGAATLTGEPQEVSVTLTGKGKDRFKLTLKVETEVESSQ